LEETMGNIVLLDDLTINKIAAGEVIERPANVVKEMVENSIDAGATSITVEIENGGISLIRITDNGKGIAPDDVELSFERHATSKIRKAEDLVKVSTMGFRGEALASIASIAKVEMITRTKENTLGVKAIVENGAIQDMEECGAPVGTTITVRELFYNTPVRYKFLKKDFTEGGYIEDVVSRIALINPNISFRLLNNKKVILQTSGNGDMQSVVYSIYGKDIATNVLNVDSEYEGIKVEGICGKPEIARSNRTNQLFYVNGRYIKDKVLTSATDEAYKTLIPVGKFGFCILNIKINQELVDVNVHPAKLEVRFSEEGKVFKAINIALKNALFSSDITIKTDKEENEENRKGFFDTYRPQINKNTKEIIEDKSERANEEKIALNIDLSSEISTKIDKEKELDLLNNTSPRINIDNKISPDDDINLSKLNIVKISDYNINDSDFDTKEHNRNLKSNLENLDLEEFSKAKLEENYANYDSNIKEEKDTSLDINNDISSNSYDKKNTNLDEEDSYEETDDEELDNDEYDEEKENGINNYLDRKKIFKISNLEENKVENLYTDSIEVDTYSKRQQESMLTDFENKSRHPEYQIIGVGFLTYIFIEINDEVYIFDQHAAHERVLYEKVKENYYKDGGKNTQMLLMPDTIELSKRDMRAIMDHLYIFEKAGFELEEFGENTIKIVGVPEICFEMNTRALFLDLVDGLDFTNKTTSQAVEEKFLATVACKAAVKANMKLSDREIRVLFDDLLSLENPFTCPHGRPTAIRITKAEIERKFKRR